jgi:putative membrane protein
VMITTQLLHQLLVAAVFSALGLVILGLVWLILVKVLPFSLRKEMEDDQNTALGIVLGCLILGISIIIAASIHG